MLATAPFVDRLDAGRRLGIALRERALDRPVIVLALPRGGVPIGYCVAEQLGAPLDAYVVRKLGVPGHEELAFGAIATGGAQVFNRDIIWQFGLTPDTVERVVTAEERELARREAEYRGGRAWPALRGTTVVVVDDGAATGASMRVAVQAIRQLGPRSIVVAVPVASRDALALLSDVADQCVCLAAPDPFWGVGHWYTDFRQVSDGEVHLLLAEARRRQEVPAPLEAATEV